MKTWTTESMIQATMNGLWDNEGDPNCIDLKREFGKVYRVKYEESYYVEYGPNGKTRDPWYMIIPGQLGEIYPFGDNILVASTHKRGGIAKKLRKHPKTKVFRDGDDGTDVLFLRELLPEIDKLLKLRKKRQLSPERKAQLAEQLKVARSKLKH